MIAIMNRIKRNKGMKPAEVPDYTEEIEEAKAELRITKGGKYGIFFTVIIDSCKYSNCQ